MSSFWYGNYSLAYKYGKIWKYGTTDCLSYWEISAESNCLVLDYSGDKGEIVLSKCFSREIVPNCPANILTFSDTGRQLRHHQKYFSQKIFLKFYFQLRLDLCVEPDWESSLVRMKYWSESQRVKTMIYLSFICWSPVVYDITSLHCLHPAGNREDKVRLWSIRAVTTSLSRITRDTQTLPGFVVTQVRYQGWITGKNSNKNIPC